MGEVRNGKIVSWAELLELTYFNCKYCEQMELINNVIAIIYWPLNAKMQYKTTTAGLMKWITHKVSQVCWSCRDT